MTSSGIDIASRLDHLHRAVYDEMPPRDLDAGDVAGSVAKLRENAALREREPLPEGVSSEDHMVPGPEGAPEIMVRLYRPTGLASGGPAFYWIHGGGMVMGSVDMSDAFCGTQAADLGILVGSVEYRLAPEHPYPAPLEDCYAGLRWFASSAGALGSIPAASPSAGAARGAGWPRPRPARARPGRDRRLLPAARLPDDRRPQYHEQQPRHHRPAPLEPRRQPRRLERLPQRPSRQRRRLTLRRPARATDLAGLAPAYINVGAFDLFLDEDVSYAQALLTAGVPTELHVYPGAFHGSPNSVPDAPSPSAGPPICRPRSEAPSSVTASAGAPSPELPRAELGASSPRPTSAAR